MAKQFLHLGVHFEKPETAPSQAAIEDVLDKATDWFRYAPNCWLIYTGRDPKTWYERLQAIPGMNDQAYLICEVNLNRRSGWLQKNVWEWIKAFREE